MKTTNEMRGTYLVWARRESRSKAVSLPAPVSSRLSIFLDSQPNRDWTICTMMIRMTTISAANILGSLWYCWFLAAFGILSIFIPFADGVCRKDPWNWEYDCAESNVAAKKALLEKEAAEAQQ